MNPVFNFFFLHFRCNRYRVHTSKCMRLLQLQYIQLRGWNTIYILTQDRNFHFHRERLLNENPSSLESCQRGESSLVRQTSEISIFFLSVRVCLIMIWFVSFFLLFTAQVSFKPHISAETRQREAGGGVGGGTHPSPPILSSLRLTVRVVGLLPRWLKSWLSHCGIWGSTLHVFDCGHFE